MSGEEERLRAAGERRMDGNRDLPFEGEELGRLAHDAFMLRAVELAPACFTPPPWEEEKPEMKVCWREVGLRIARMVLAGDAAQASLEVWPK